MHPKHNKHKLVLLFFIFLAIHFPGFLTQNCNNTTPFDCGVLSRLSYPFWGGSRPPSCGRSGFELSCQADDIPILISSSLPYRVLQINYSTNTLVISREDLRNSTCPRVSRNTTLNPNIFQFAARSTDVNVTLFYNCNVPFESPPFNGFDCDSAGGGLNVIATGGGASPGTNVTCGDSIRVPVNRAAARALETPTASSTDVLRDALASGFSVQWRADARQNSTRYCDRSVCISPSGGPRHIGEDPGLSPVQSPGPAPAKELDKNVLRLVLVVGLAIIGSIILIVILFCGIVACCKKRRRSPENPNPESNNKDVERFILQHGSLAPTRYNYSKIKKMTKSFNEKLGQGGYGSVYKGTLPDGRHVAVKVLIENNDSNGEEFINEVASISRTSHVNIVNLLGFCYDKRKNKRALVYEFMPNKSLDKFIRTTTTTTTTDSHLDVEKLYEIAVGVAKGLEYLHTGCNTRIVHFDIKPQNILLDEDFCPKISDFGLAKLCKKKQSILSMLGTRGTIGYIAPEVFSRNFGGVSHKSDVYSYGMMVLEMAGAGKLIGTYRDQELQSSENYFPDKVYEHVVDDVGKKLLEGSTIEEEGDEARKMFLVGFWCIQTNPSDRPSMSKVVEMLEGSLESIQIPPKPVLCAPPVSRPEFSSSFSVYVETEDSDESHVSK